MKKYKLLKDLPGLEAGTIILNIKDDCQFEKLKPNKEQLEALKLICFLIKNNNKNWLEEIKEEPKTVYNLSNGDKFYYIDEYGEIDYKFWNEKISKEKLEVGNVFLTKEEAEKELEKRKALTKIKKWIWENKPDINKKNGYYSVIRKNIDTNELEVKGLYSEGDYIGVNEIIFNFDDEAQKCLDELRKEWEILFNFK